MEPIYPFVHSAFHSINSPILLHIHYFLLFHKVTYHLAQLEKLTVVVMSEKFKHTVEEQEVHTVEVLASKRDLGYFSG